MIELGVTTELEVYSVVGRGIVECNLVAVPEERIGAGPVRRGSDVPCVCASIALPYQVSYGAGYFKVDVIRRSSVLEAEALPSVGRQIHIHLCDASTAGAIIDQVIESSSRIPLTGLTVIVVNVAGANVQVAADDNFVIHACGIAGQIKGDLSVTNKRKVIGEG